MFNWSRLVPLFQLKKFTQILKTAFVAYRPSEAEKEFCSLNGKYWSSSRARPGILIEGSLTTPQSLLEKCLIAKICEKRFDLSSEIVVSCLFRRSTPAYPVVRSFGIDSFICSWWLYILPSIALKSLFVSLNFFRINKSGKDVMDYKLDGIWIGDLIYDSLIRYCPNSYTVDKLSIRRHFRLVFRSICLFYFYDGLMKRKAYSAYITSHRVYAEYGIACRLAHNSGALVLLKDMDVFRLYTPSDSILEHFLRVQKADFLAATNDPNVVSAAEEYFRNRMSGVVNQVDIKNAHTGKRVYSLEELSTFNPINPTRFNVFVLCHAFSDAPHVSGSNIFQDYYVWLAETLIELSRNDAVNVFVKPHPSSYMWNERGAVEQLMEQLRVDFDLSNVFVLPRDFSPIGIRNIADCIVTVRGTAGLEYSGFGIPAVTCAESYYSGFGISHDFRSQVDYRNALREIEKIGRLTETQELAAKVLLYLTFGKLKRSKIAAERPVFPGDDEVALRASLFSEMYRKLIQFGDYDDEFVQCVEGYISRSA